MRPTKPKPTYNGVIFDSPEEIEFYQWCEEAMGHNLITEFVFHPKTFELAAPVTCTKYVHLKTKTKPVTKTLLQGCNYTADFMLSGGGVLSSLCRNEETYMYWIDVKGEFSMHNDAVKFSLIQKWVMQKHGVFINKVIPKEFFKKTFVPTALLTTPATKKPSKKYAGYPTIKEFLGGLNGHQT